MLGNKFREIIILGIIVLALSQLTYSQTDFFVTQNNSPAPGYLYFDWQANRAFALVDHYGKQFYYKEPSNGFRGSFFKRLDNNLWALFTNTRFYIYDDNMILIDSISKHRDYALDFHDIISLKNGNYLILATDEVVMDLSNRIEGGQPNAIVLVNVLLEVDYKGNVYWKWHALDYVEITDATEDISLTDMFIDLTHINSMFETTNGDIVVSIRHFDEVACISKSTGQFLWRLGGSKSSKNEFTIINDNIDGFTGFSHQHSATILNNGNLLIYDNGNLKPKQYSRAVEYSLDLSKKTATKVWEYRYTPDIYQSSLGTAYRLPNGNTLINWGRTKITEVKPDKTIAFEITYYSGNVYRAQKVTSKAIISSQFVNSKGNYNFISEHNNTGINLQIDNLSSPTTIHVQKHNYPPHSGTFTDSTFSTILPYRWVITTGGSASFTGKIKISTNNIDIANPRKATLYKRDKEASGNFYPLATSFSELSGEIIAQFDGLGEFVLVSNVLAKPILISPEKLAKITSSGNLLWEKVPGAIKYQLQVSKTSKFDNFTINTITNNLTNYKYSDLIPGIQYFWRVRAINPKDTSAWSEVYEFAIIAEPPALKYPSDNTTGFYLSDTLKWNKQTENEKYWLQISTEPTFDNPVINVNNLALPLYQISSLDYETKYYWRTAILTDNENVLWSQIWNFTTTFREPIPIIPLIQSINIVPPVTFEWNTVHSVDYFSFELSKNKEFTDIAYSQSDLRVKFLILDNFDFDCKYYWRVKSQKNNISSDWSETYNFTTSLPAPNLLSYDDNFKELFFDQILYSQNSIILRNLEHNRLYYWRIRAVDGEKISDWSQTWQFSTLSKYLLNQPRLNGPWNNGFALIEGNLSWNKVTNATFYQVQLSTGSSFNNDLLINDKLTDSVRRFSGLEYERRYFWRVRALNQTDSSDWSTVRRFTTMAKVYQPTLFRPVNDQMQVPLNGAVECFTVPAIDYYMFQVSESPNFDVIIKEADVGLNRRMEYENLEPNKRYYWRAAFFRDGALSNWSNVWTFMTKTEDTIVSPKALSPNDFTLVNPVAGLNVKWSSVVDATSYEIALSSSWSFDDKVAKYKISNDTTYHLSELDFRNFYYWRVSAVKENAQSAWSNLRNFITMLKPPVILYPENNVTDIPFDGRIVWTYDDTTAWFRYQIATDIDFNNIVLQTDSIRDHHHEYVLAKNTEYYIRMRAYDFFNRSVWTEPIKFTTGSTTDINDNHSKSRFSVYPNPAKDYIVIADFDVKSFKIIDILGNTVQTLNDFRAGFRHDISALSNGMYFVIITDARSKIWRQVLVKTE